MSHTKVSRNTTATKDAYQSRILRRYEALLLMQHLPQTEAGQIEYGAVFPHPTNPKAELSLSRRALALAVILEVSEQIQNTC